MIRRFALIFALVPSMALAHDWERLDAAGIRAALTGQTYAYAKATQTFYASGKTVYGDEAKSWGRWRIENDQFCSQWPPNDLWACYDVLGQHESIRFIGQGGDETDGWRVD